MLSVGSMDRGQTVGYSMINNTIKANKLTEDTEIPKNNTDKLELSNNSNNTKEEDIGRVLKKPNTEQADKETNKIAKEQIQREKETNQLNKTENFNL